MSPLIPLAILVVGAGLVVLTLLLRFSLATATAIISAVLALIATAALAVALPARGVLSDWTAAALLPVGLEFRVDGAAWLLAMGMVLLLLAALLTGLARPGGPRVPARAAMLLLTFAGLGALFADNVITLLMAWAGLDFIYFVTLILLARGEGVQPQAVLHLTFNSFGTLSLLAAALVIGQSAADYVLNAATIRQSTTLLITLAAVFRLGLFPLHLGLPLEVTVRQGLGTLLRLIPVTVALDALARLATLGFAEPTRPWLTLFGVVAVVVGAAQLWNTDDARQGLASVIIAQSGLALLAGLWGGAQAVAGVVALALGLLLGGGLLYLSNGFDSGRRWLSALAGIGLATLIAAPLTVGFTGLHALYADWQSRFPIVLVVIVGAQSVLTVGLLRALTWPADPIEGGRWRMIGYVAGLGSLAAPALLGGVLAQLPGAWLGIPGFVGLTADMNWLAAALGALTVLLGAGLWRSEALIRARAASTAALAFSILRLDWLYRGLWSVLQRVGRLIESVAGVLEGEGAMLWALAVALAVVLVLR
jgi:formate hydrogenlyase subunit 3/multisubunit Na+/H+ antiporter MnhD subunit